LLVFFSLSFHSGKKKSPVFHLVVCFSLFFSFFLELQRGLHFTQVYIIFLLSAERVSLVSVLDVVVVLEIKIQTKKAKKERFQG